MAKAKQTYVEYKRKYPLTLEEAHIALAKAAHDDFVVFFALMTGGKTLKPHQLKWVTLFTDETITHKVVVAPRNSGKTTVMELFMVWNIGRHPERTNLIMCVGEAQSTARFLAIRSWLETDAFHHVFPNVLLDKQKQFTSDKFDVWDNNFGSYAAWRTWEVAHKEAPTRDRTLYCAALHSNKVVGSRVTGILWLDDIMDQKNTATTHLINKTYDYIERTALPTMNKGAQLIHISTRWAPDDVVERHMAKKGWVSQVLQAITYVDDEPVSYWPEEWPVERLMAIKESDEGGAVAFEIMYQNNPFASTGEMFERDQLELMLPHPLPDMTRGVYIGVDPAFGEKNRNDNTAIVMIGFDGKPRPNAYLLDIRVGKYKKEKLIEILEAMYDMAIDNYGGCRAIYVEKVAAQALLIDDLIRETELPIVAAPVAKKGDKVAKTQTFSMLAVRKRYFGCWDNKYAQMHRMECLNFPTGRHDDTVDAVSIVMNMRLGFYRGARRSKAHIVTINMKEQEERRKVKAELRALKKQERDERQKARDERRRDQLERLKKGA